MARFNADQFYVDGVALDQSYWRALDTSQMQSWNGDVGSSHTPAAPITIAGAGMWLTGPASFSGTFPNGLNFTTSTPLVHGSNDWIVTLPLRTRQPLTGLGDAADCSYVPTITTATQDPQSHAITPPSQPSLARMRFTASTDGITNVCPGDSTGGINTLVNFPSYYQGGRIQRQLRVHHNGVLATVFFNFQIAGPRIVLPANQARFRAISVDTFGNVTPLATNGANGWVSVGASSPAAYYNAGGIQQLTYTCDANIRIDITQNTYWVQIEDESDAPPKPSPPTPSNAMAGNQFLSVTSTLNNIGDIRPA